MIIKQVASFVYRVKVQKSDAKRTAFVLADMKFRQAESVAEFQAMHGGEVGFLAWLNLQWEKIAGTRAIAPLSVKIRAGEEITDADLTLARETALSTDIGKVSVAEILLEQVRQISRSKKLGAEEKSARIAQILGIIG